MWTLILTVSLQLISWFLDRQKASIETKKAFFDFVKKVGQDFQSAKLMEYGDAQLQWLLEHPWEESK